MKITFVLPYAGMAGGTRVVGVYADQLHRRGHEVTVVSLPRRPLTLRQKVRALLRGEGWPKTQKAEPSHLENLEATHYVLERHRPITDADLPDADVVIATWWETAEWVWRLSPSKGVKVHFVQDYEIWGSPAEVVDVVYHLPIPKIVIAPWLTDLLETRFHQTPIATILNGVDSKRFYASPRQKQRVPTVGFTYSAKFDKGCDISLRAYDIARSRIPNLRLVTCSNMPISPELPLPAGTCNTYSARDEQLRLIYGQCDAWLFSSRREGFGLPILEAMACRTPVIATPAGAAPALIQNGSGFLVKEEDPEEMAAAIEKVIKSSESEWQAMSEAAHRVAAQYNWDDATSQFLDALDRAIQQKASAEGLPV